MMISPDYDSFARAYEAGEAQIVSTRLVADLETPVSAMLKLARNARYSFLLESVEGGAVRGRYSIIGMNPDLIWKVEGGQGLDQPQGRSQSRRAVRAAGPAAAGIAAGAAGRKPHQAAGGCAAHGGRRLRLHGLRHGAADGGPAGAQSRYAGPARLDADPPHHHGDLRQRARRGDGDFAGLSRARRHAARRLCARPGAHQRDRRCAGPAARSSGDARGRAAHRRAHAPTPRPTNTRRWC